MFIQHPEHLNQEVRLCHTLDLWRIVCVSYMPSEAKGRCS